VPGEKNIKLSVEEEAAIIEEAVKRYNESWTADYDERGKAIEDLEMLAGEHQWAQIIENQRVADDRPCVTVNMLPGFHDIIVGQIRQRKMTIKVMPKGGGASKNNADVMSDLIRQIEYSSDAIVAYETASDSASACGRGFWRVLTQYTDDELDENPFDQEIIIERIPNAFSVVWEQGTKKLDLSDSKFMFVLDRMSKEDFEEAYSGATLSGFNAYEENLENGYEGWFTDEGIMVAEYWRKTNGESRTIYELENGDNVDEIPKNGKFKRKRVVQDVVVEWYKVTAKEILESGKWAGKYIPIIPVWGKEINIGEKRDIRGIVRNAKSSQQIYNYTRSSEIEVVALAPKAPFIASETQVQGENKEHWANSHKKSMGVLLYKPDPMAQGKPERVQPATVPAGLVNSLQISKDELHQTTGLYPPSLGQRSNETSGVAIERRVEQGDVATFAYVDNYHRAMIFCGKVLIDLIPKIYDTPREIATIKIDESSEFININGEGMDEKGNEPIDFSKGRFEPIVTIGKSFATKREEAATKMIELLAVLPPEVTVAVAELIVENLDFPGAEKLRKRLQKFLPPGVLEEGDDGAEEIEQAPQEPNPEEVFAIKKAEIELDQEKTKLQGMEVENRIKLLKAHKIKKEIEQIGKESNEGKSKS